VPRQERVDVLDRCPRRRHITEGEIKPHGLFGETSWHQTAGEKGLDFGGEDQPFLIPRVVERLDAESIACDEQATSGAIPDREGEHAPEAVDALRAQLLVEIQDDFRISVGAKAVPPLFEPGALFLKVVDFAVVDDPQGSVLRGHRLVPRVR